MMDGRFFLGLGTGENLNEHIVGQGWPETEVRQERLLEAVQVIRRLWTGDNVSHHGRHFTVENARLYSCPRRRRRCCWRSAAPERRSGRAGGRRHGRDRPVGRGDQPVSAGRRRRKPRYAELTVCWARSESAARRTAREVWPIAAMESSLSLELPLPAHFEAVAAGHRGRGRRIGGLRPCTRSATWPGSRSTPTPATTTSACTRSGGPGGLHALLSARAPSEGPRRSYRVNRSDFCSYGEPSAHASVGFTRCRPGTEVALPRTRRKHGMERERGGERVRVRRSPRWLRRAGRKCRPLAAGVERRVGRDAGGGRAGARLRARGHRARRSSGRPALRHLARGRLPGSGVKRLRLVPGLRARWLGGGQRLSPAGSGGHGGPERRSGGGDRLAPGFDGWRRGRLDGLGGADDLTHYRTRRERAAAGGW